MCNYYNSFIQLEHLFGVLGIFRIDLYWWDIWASPKDVHPVPYGTKRIGKTSSIELYWWNQWNNPKDVHSVLYGTKRIGWTSRIELYWWDIWDSP